MPRGMRREWASAHAARSKGVNTDGAPRPAAAEGDRAQAADGATQGREPERGQGTGRAHRGAGRASGCMERSEGRWASAGAAKSKGTGTGRARAPAVQDRAWVTGGGTHGTGRGTEAWGLEGGQRARARAPRAPRDRQDRAWEPRGGRRVGEREAGGGAPPQPDVQPVRCIPPGIQQMPAHHIHHQAHLYNIDPDAGELIPPQPPRPQHQPAPLAPRAEPARMASEAGGWGAAPAPQAQGPQGEPARGAGGARPWNRVLGTVADPLGDGALPLVGQVYGWLSWANQGTTRGMRNRPFDAVLLRRDGENQEVPPGGVSSPRGPREAPQVSDLGAVARQGADVAGLPERGGGALHHGCGRQQLAPPGLAQRPHQLALPLAQPATATAPAPTQAAAQVTAQTADAREWGGELAPPTHAFRTIRLDGGACATSRGREGGDNEHGGEPTAPQPASR